MSDLPPYRLPRHIVPEHYELSFELDFDAAAFSGEATVQLVVRDQAAEVVVNAAELEISHATLRRDGREVTAEVSYREDEEQAVFTPVEPLATGPWDLHMRFTGKLNDLLRGFYRSTFRREDGTKAQIATTQFESTDARRAFPCWDEPDFKATYGITLVVPEDLVALSNSHEISSEPIGSGKRRVRFAKTMKMSTYLVAMVVGPFEMTEPKDVDGVPLRIAYTPGRDELAWLAQDSAAHALSFFREYFSIPYPGDKLDHIAIPDFAAGAMENLGLVTYRETALLVPRDSAQVEQARVAQVVGHETAHMWFGDLVTMKWWEGIWLNEAFATFMELLATDHFRPDWKVWASFGVDRASALLTDSLHSTRAIEFPVGRPEEAEDMFDVITYDKGASVLRMLERYLGDEAFRRGLNIYLDKHKFANTVTTDLWDALEVGSGQPVRATMDTWVNQAGHPIVSASLAGGATGAVTFRQRRFFLDGSPDDGQRWVVPLTLRYERQDGAVGRHQLLFDSDETTLELEGAGAEGPAWLLVNDGAWGVYRANYDTELRRRLNGALGQLDESERLQLVTDTWAAAVAGEAPVSAALELFTSLRRDHDPDVWLAISAALNLIDDVCDEEQRALLKAGTRALAGPLFNEIGWEGTGDESARTVRLRPVLVSLLGQLGEDEAVRAGARERFDASRQGTALPADLATAIARVVSAAGGEEEWTTLYERFKSAATPQDEVRYLQALGATNDPALISRALDVAFSDDVRVQDGPFLLASILNRRQGCVLAWEAIESHWEDILAKWPHKVVPRVFGAMPALVTAGAEAAARAERWIDEHPLGWGDRQIAQARERLHINLAFRERVAGELGEALARLG
ncbi:MAG TPA: M1 family metallopeptidase [Acidimicrobiales bacterium]|nr:M1 family metallopeptidase [Acidimicrobiales bacterium]